MQGEVHPVFLGSALPAFPVSACCYSFSCLHGWLSVICGQEPGAFAPAVCSVLGPGEGEGGKRGQRAFQAQGRAHTKRPEVGSTAF